MDKRFNVLLEKLNLTASDFATKIEVQRSAMSHILSGRNKPSVAVLNKIINKFTNVNIEWLISGKGEILKIEQEIQTSKIENKKIDTEKILNENDEEEVVEKIMLFYSDKTFEEMRKRK